ncbi:MAG: ABC transporter ATP-binding protein [Lachnospiraceae bacterium]|nr:ABC transporter ATP-binding protein [Lachnospiraceae bacterium]
MKEVNKEEKTKQSFKEVFGNNLFLLKLMFTASPVYITFMALDAIRGQLSIFFEHTVGIGYVLEAAEFNYPFKRVAAVILLLAAAITLGMVFTVYVGNYISERERPKIRQKIKLQLYEKAKELDLACYDDPEFYNDQVLAISEVDKQIDRGLQFIQNTLSGITVFISTGIYFLMKDKVSILFAAISFVMSFVFNQMYNKQNYLVRVESIPYSRKRDYVKRIFYLNDYAKEIRLNPGVSDILFKRFEEANDEVYMVEKKHTKKKFLFGFLSRYVSNAMLGDVIYISYLVYQAAVCKTLSFSTVAILYNSIGRMKNGMRIFTDVYPFACETSLYVSKIRKFLNYEPNIVSERNLIPSQKAKEIELKDVSFGYGADSDMILKNLNLHMKPGEKIALVGYNGAGKTTFVKLLMRLYDVKSGSILADGIDIRDYNVKQYRNTIGTVFQDFQIFAGNVRENVILDVANNKDFSNSGYEYDTNIRQALSDSGLLKRVDRLKNGLDTELTTEFSKDGVNLSGGESQKLAIARVFYKDAGLMILDEPSSALDPIAEYQLNHAMLEATKDKTVVFISHRLSTTRLADRIVMLENGCIVEQGSHEELLTKNGKYAEMWRVQAGAYIAV